MEYKEKRLIAKIILSYLIPCLVYFAYLLLAIITPLSFIFESNAFMLLWIIIFLILTEFEILEDENNDRKEILY